MRCGAAPHRDRVLTCTHLGGHRFAPTTLLLPVGALHGRLDGASAADLMTQARTGRTTGAGLRGFSTLGEPEQVAEAHVRALTGYTGLAPLQVELAHCDDPDRLLAEVRGPDLPTSWVPLLRTHLEVQPSCGRPPTPAPRWTPTP